MNFGNFNYLTSIAEISLLMISGSQPEDFLEESQMFGICSRFLLFFLDCFSIYMDQTFFMLSLCQKKPFYIISFCMQISNNFRDCSYKLAILLFENLYFEMLFSHRFDVFGKVLWTRNKSRFFHFLSKKSMLFTFKIKLYVFGTRSDGNN